VKVEQDAHILELQEIHSSNPKEVDIKFKNFIVGIACEATIEIIGGLKECFLRNFPTRPNLSFVIKLDYNANLPDVSSVGKYICFDFNCCYLFLLLLLLFFILVGNILLLLFFYFVVYFLLYLL
jgi:hypothetical protein